MNIDILDMTTYDTATVDEYGEAFGLIALIPGTTAYQCMTAEHVFTVGYTLEWGDKASWSCQIDELNNGIIGGCEACESGATPRDAVINACAELVSYAALIEEDNAEDAVNRIAYDIYKLATDSMPATAKDYEELDHLLSIAAEIVISRGWRYGIKWEPYRVCDNIATEEQRATVAAMVEAIAAKATEDAGTLTTYPTEGAAYVAGARELVPVITHEDAADAYAAAEEATQAIPAAHNRKRHDARTAAVDAIVRSRARYADKDAAAAHIAGQPVDYLHRHTINLGTRCYPDYRPAYEQRRADRLYLSATASKTGKSIDRVSISFVVLVLD